MGTPIRIWDTAGMRKKARVVEKLEKLSVADGLRAVRFAEVVVVLLDVEIPFEVQDLRIADFAETEGRAVVVAVNKWDLEDEQAGKAGRTERDVRAPAAAAARRAAGHRVRARPGGASTACMTRSCKAHDGLEPPGADGAAELLARRMTEAHPPPAPGGHRIKLRYMTQAKTRPPGFVIKCSRPDDVPESYKRYLVNGLRDHFDMPGTPIRLFLRGQGDQNPFRENEVPHPLAAAQAQGKEHRA
jgi:GTP-binding protein